MSNYEDRQQVFPNSSIQDNTFPVTVMDTVVGPTEVSDKAYDVQGQVVDSTDEIPVDVNAISGIGQYPTAIENVFPFNTNSILPPMVEVETKPFVIDVEQTFSSENTADNYYFVQPQN